MDDAGPLGRAIESAWSFAAVGVDLIVEPVQVAVRPPGPDVVGHRLSEDPELLLVRAKLSLGKPAVVHVLDDTVPADDLARRVPSRVSARAHPAVLSRRCDTDAVIDVDRLAGCKAGREGRDGVRQVVGMERLGPARAIWLTRRLAREVEPALGVGGDVAFGIAGPGHLRVQLDGVPEVVITLAQTHFSIPQSLAGPMLICAVAQDL